MPFRRDVQRLPIFGLGCGGGVLGLSRAAALAQAQPGSRWLFLVVELCGITFRGADLSKSNIIATALFGDGAAAAIVQVDHLASGWRVGVSIVGPIHQTSWAGISKKTDSACGLVVIFHNSLGRKCVRQQIVSSNSHQCHSKA